MKEKCWHAESNFSENEDGRVSLSLIAVASQPFESAFDLMVNELELHCSSVRHLKITELWYTPVQLITVSQCHLSQSGDRLGGKFDYGCVC